LTLFDRLVLFLASGFGLGYLAESAAKVVRRFEFVNIPERWSGGGLLGSLLGLGLVFAGMPVSGWAGGAVLLLLTVGGTWIAGRAETLMGPKDDPRIVIDEVAGMAWSLAFIPLSGDRRMLYGIWALVLFRVFDVFKLPSRRVQNLRGGLGVMTDDILAGMLANAVLQAFLYPW
jgi:phosphatidylglycerophosphatase A